MSFHLVFCSGGDHCQSGDSSGDPSPFRGENPVVKFPGVIGCWLPCIHPLSIAESQVDRWPGAIVMAKQTIYSMLLLHVSLAFATKAKEVFSAEDPQAALRKLKSESLPQAWFFVWFCWGWNFQQGRNKLGVRFKFRWCFRPGVLLHLTASRYPMLEDCKFITSASSLYPCFPAFQLAKSSPGQSKCKEKESIGSQAWRPGEVRWGKALDSGHLQVFVCTETGWERNLDRLFDFLNLRCHFLIGDTSSNGWNIPLSC